MEKNIVAFERPADFYYRSALRMMDDGHYIGALSMYRRALDKDPGNMEYSVGYAELLTDMCKFEESNSILFDLLLRDEDLSPDCFFNLGRNFLGLNDFSKAKDSFEKYIEDEPDGEYMDDLEDMYFLLEGSFDTDLSLISDVEEKSAVKNAMMGKRALDAGAYEKAAEYLEKIKVEGTTFMFAKNNLALAYFCMGRKEEALRETEEVLGVSPDNIHANCNMALFLKEKSGSDARIEQHMQKVLSIKTEMPDDLYKISITLCELGRHAEALPYLASMRDYNPYDEKILFYMAIALYNCGNYKEAIAHMSDIIVLDPPGIVPAYYIGVIKEVMAGQAEFSPLGYAYQVPPDEVKRRIKYLNDCLHLDTAVFSYKWRHDKPLRDTIVWGLESGDNYIKKAMVEILAEQGDRQAEKILRRFLLRQNQPDEIKNNVFVALKKMDAEEPYVAYMDFHIVEVRVGTYENEGKPLSKEWMEIFGSIRAVMDDHYPQHVERLADCMQRLEKYVQSVEYAEIANDAECFAAALHHIAFKSMGIKVDIDELAAHYGSSGQEVQAMIDRLLKH